MAKDTHTLSTKTDAELKKELATLRKGLHDFRFGIAGSKVRNVKEGNTFRKQIARVLTELRKRA